MKPSVKYYLHRLGKMIREERIKRGESQHLFSFRAAVHRTTLARVERGDPGVSIGTIIQILRVLNRDELLLQLIVGEKPNIKQGWD